MLIDVVSFLNSAIDSVSQWFYIVFVRTGVRPLYFVMIFVYMSVRYLLSPVLGTAMGVYLGSDMAASRRRYSRSSQHKALPPGRNGG